MRQATYIDQLASRIDWENPTLSMRRLKESFEETSVRRFRETNPEGAFGALLRAGVSSFAMNSYNLVPVVYPDLVTEVTSRRFQELYAPLFRPNLPKYVARGARFQDNPIVGMDRTLANYKFGMIESFERELFDDDQTGQIKNRAAQMGENFKIMEEIWIVGKITGTGFTSQGIFVPPDITYADTYTGTGNGTYNTAPKANRPASFARLSQATLEAADIALMNITDDVGNMFLVSPNTLIVSSTDKFVAAKLLNSTLQPSVPSAVADSTGYVMTVNPLKGLYRLLVSRFLPARAWYLGDPKKAMILQRRDPLEIVQEHPASGASFDMDCYRFKARARFGAGMIDSRFMWVGNDGSV